MLPVINSAEMSNLGMKNKEGLEKRGESNFKKVHYYYSIVQEFVQLDINCISKITKSACNFLNLYLTMFKDNAFVFILIFTVF